MDPAVTRGCQLENSAATVAPASCSAIFRGAVKIASWVKDQVAAVRNGAVTATLEAVKHAEDPVRTVLRQLENSTAAVALARAGSRCSCAVEAAIRPDDHSVVRISAVSAAKTVERRRRPSATIWSQ